MFVYISVCGRVCLYRNFEAPLGSHGSFVTNTSEKRITNEYILLVVMRMTLTMLQATNNVVIARRLIKEQREEKILHVVHVV